MAHPTANESLSGDDAAVAGPAKAAADLGWHSFVRGLAGRCVGEAAVERLGALMPAATLAEARERMERTAQALQTAALGEPVPARAVPHLDEIVARIRRGGIATAEQLTAVAETLAAAQRLRPYAKGRRDGQPALAEILWSEPSLDGLLSELRVSIDDEGRITDEASADLARARRQVGTLRRSLRQKLTQLAAHYSDVLRDGQIVQREGRLALPVRSDAHRRVEGIVLGSSASGATLYVEPRQTTEMSNRLKMAEGDVEREEARVLAELSATVGEQLEAIADAHEACIQADMLAALSSWAEHSGSIAVVPESLGRLELRAVRHPLLVMQGSEVVANDVTVRCGSALVISGPNAGGKTVTLKCLGLVVWMAQSGIPMPLQEGSRVGWYERVLTNFGDAQSLERSLSTFSAEIANLTGIIEQADERSLVLLDEIAASTDPDEGSALAAAALEALVERNAAVAATTHYERLKELAGSGERFVNGSVGFDFERMLPTFELTSGVPGASSALAVAARHGLPAAVVDRAKQLLSRPAVDRQRLLEQLEQERLTLQRSRQRAEQDADQARRLREELESERRLVRQKERNKLAGEAASLTRAVREARAKLQDVQLRLRSPASRQSLRDVEREVDSVARQVAIGSPLQQATEPPNPAATAAPISPDELRPGVQVYVPKLGATAEIAEEPARGQVRVLVGGLTSRLAVSELRRPAEGANRPPRRAKAPARSAARPAGAAGTTAPQAAIRTSDSTCDLRGLRVDEALDELDVFIDRCLQNDETVGFALHGHGTGALKQAVREHLALSPLVGRSRPAEQGEGGDAFTVFWLQS